MTALLDRIEPWFLQLAVLVLGGYFLWSLKNVLTDFKDEVKGLRETIGKLFDRSDRFEKRLSNLEGRCDAIHGSGGRREYDPPERSVLDGDDGH